MRNLTALSESTSMNYHRSQFSKHLHYFLMIYGYCTICGTSPISGTSGRHAFQLVEIIEDALKCYISLQNNYSKLIKQFPIRLLYLYAVLPLVPLLAKLAQIDH